MFTEDEVARCNTDYLRLLTPRTPRNSMHALAVCLRDDWSLDQSVRKRRHTLFIRVMSGRGTVTVGDVASPAALRRSEAVQRGRFIVVPPASPFSVTRSEIDEKPLRFIVYAAHALWPQGLRKPRP
jgi:mannose-6-phosphate isomerase-like protein (cupin superfamily)